MARISTHAFMASALAITLFSGTAHAQSLPYGDPGDSEAISGGDSAPSGTDAPRGGDSRSGGRSLGNAGGSGRMKIQPYIELSQSVLARLQPTHETLTYSSVAVGVDASLTGRRTEGSVSVRYERRFAESGNIVSNDTISGLARVRHDLVPRELTIEAGGLATRTRFDPSGASRLGSVETGDRVAQVYSLYAGPAVSTHVGEVAVKGSYLLGYTKVNTPRLPVTGLPAGQPQPQGDIFNHSVAQSAQASVGVAPGTVLPIGLTASGAYNQEDIANLDQRVRELRAGLQATLPINQELALIGDVGWQDVKVSSRDAVRGPGGVPVVGSDGRYVTDKSKPRQIAYDVTGLTWDVGVMWRPSRRTSLSAFVGRRYDSMTYYGSLSYTPNARNALQIDVFDAVSGFGSTIGNAVRGLPTDFTADRNPFSGDISGCAAGAQSGGCVNGALGSIASAAFRTRGVSASYSHSLGKLRMGLGAGYLRRKFIGAKGTVLEAANGRTDQNFYVSGQISGPIDRLTAFTVAVYDSWYKSGVSELADVNSFGVNAGLTHQFTRRLVGNAGVGLDMINRKAFSDDLIATGQVGLRYNF
ncbi:hypothetical protein NSE01_07140 [Novosphingobium sediminis]|uniref:Preprotein translocase subunit YajC n=1 Tax=Novosphingobium sediminis TaxID=707214 RepID=A0A512AGS2_9SPHN|nr:preprotein translocase subunit YajC [Novosphingobium sediminis]GEN98881.1 hypothetical protein NSE01_07140 [Novosphingobium sediminis]